MPDVVLPVLDRTDTLPWVLGRMPADCAPVVVDDGSIDGSADVARRHGARVVEEPRWGFGAAGLAVATGDVGCFMDADASLDPPDLPRVAGSVLAGEADLVLGRRRPERGAWPWSARAANRALALELCRRRLPLGGPGLQIGMDTPQVTPALLEGALEALGPTGAVLGPALDGGWWGLGLHRPERAAFLGVPMSTARTGAAPLRRLAFLGSSVGLLPALRDVGRFGDALAVAAPATRFAAAAALAAAKAPA